MPQPSSPRSPLLPVGVWSALGAYIAWGLFPIYWKFLKTIPAPVLLCHRIFWSCIVLLVVLGLTGKMNDLRESMKKPRVLGIYTVAALLIAVNWLTFVWAVNAGYIVETSLGYFINPLLNVLFGCWIFGERLRTLQWPALLLAALGVGYLTILYGAVPWIALILAVSFGLYGVVKKVAPLGAIHGLALETIILLIPSICYLTWSTVQDPKLITANSVPTWILLVGTGLVTTIPLVLFAAAAQRIPLVLVGLFQYIAPSLQFTLGVLVYQEPFDRTRWIGFMMVWIALLLFALENFFHQSRVAARKKQAKQDEVTSSGEAKVST